MVVLLVIFAGFILFLLGKVPLFRWIGITIITTIKYAFITILNVLAIGMISGVTAIGVALVLALFHYLDWALFMAGNEILIVKHDGFFVASFLIALCFVMGILFGTLIFSFVPLSTRRYIIVSYATGVIAFILLLPIILQFYVPEVEATLLGRVIICALLPVLGLIFAIATGQQRKERRREMTMEERRREDEEERRKSRFSNAVIFPWMRARTQ